MVTRTSSPTPASTVAGATPRRLGPVLASASAASDRSTGAGARPPTPAGEPPALQAFASTVAGAASVSPLAPWQRVDAAWPVIANSPTGLDDNAQKLVRRLLTQAAGQRLAHRRQLEAAALWRWEPAPHLAGYVRQRRFYAPVLRRFPPPDLCQMLRVEARLALEIITTPPGALASPRPSPPVERESEGEAGRGTEVWQELLELQCQRLGQLLAALQHWLGAARAQQVLQGILEALM